jgi:hypothetical protein
MANYASIEQNSVAAQYFSNTNINLSVLLGLGTSPTSMGSFSTTMEWRIANFNQTLTGSTGQPVLGFTWN